MKSPRIRNPRRKPTELPRSRIPKTKMHYPKDKRFINNFSKDMKLLQEKEEKRYKMKCYRSNGQKGALIINSGSVGYKHKNDFSIGGIFLAVARCQS